MFPEKTGLICPNCEGQYVWLDHWAFVKLKDDNTCEIEAAYVCRGCRWWKKVEEDRF